MGTPDFAAKSLDALYKAGIEVCGVFSQPDKPRGRGMKLSPSPVKSLALEHGTPVYTPRKLRDGSALRLIEELAPDLIAVVAYGRILPEEILNYPHLGSVNMHGSLLPKYRGAAPVQWALIRGEKKTGVTAMYMAPELDAGDMIDKVETEIGPEEDFGSLYERLGDLAAELLVKTVSRLAEGKVEREPQNGALATFAPPITKEMRPLHWEESAVTLQNLVRGLSPAPAAEGEIAGIRFKIFAAKAENFEGNDQPGTVLSADKKGILVRCGEGALRITQLQAPGGKRMSAADYLRGHPLSL